MPAPQTSTTLLRQLAADSQHVRWGEFVCRYQPMMAEYLRVHFPGLEAEDIVSETLIALVDVLKNYRYVPEESGNFPRFDCLRAGEEMSSEQRRPLGLSSAHHFTVGYMTPLAKAGLLSVTSGCNDLFSNVRNLYTRILVKGFATIGGWALPDSGCE